MHRRTINVNYLAVENLNEPISIFIIFPWLDCQVLMMHAEGSPYGIVLISSWNQVDLFKMFSCKSLEKKLAVIWVSKQRLIFQDSHRDNPGSLSLIIFLRPIGFLHVQWQRKEEFQFGQRRKDKQGKRGFSKAQQNPTESPQKSSGAFLGRTRPWSFSRNSERIQCVRCREAVLPLTVRRRSLTRTLCSFTDLLHLALSAEDCCSGPLRQIGADSLRGRVPHIRVPAFSRPTALLQKAPRTIAVVCADMLALSRVAPTFSGGRAAKWLLGRPDARWPLSRKPSSGQGD